MKLFLQLILIFFTCFIFTQDNDTEFEGKQEDTEMQALRKWLRNKRMITIKEIGGDLSLSGEVRVEMQGTNEKKNSIRQRGPGGATSKPTYAWDVEVNLMLDYRTDRTWSAVKLEFDNDMGTISGTTSKIALEKAYLGGRLYDGATLSFDAEIGRRFLGNVFDSKIEFGSLFDGALLKLSKASEVVGNFYINFGAFLVNDKKNHYGYVGEIGLLRIRNTGVFIKYSLIDWKKSFSDPRQYLAFNYIDSQMILGYQSKIPKWNKFFKLYLAGLLNHAAKKIELTNYKKENYGFYAGFSIGQIKKAKDWAFDTNYQLVAAQAIPDFDASGIKRGNAEGIGFYTTGKYGTGNYTTKSTAVGSCNYQGWQAELLYAFTSNLTLLQNIQVSRSLEASIGPIIKFFQYEIEFIYAF